MAKKVGQQAQRQQEEGDTRALLLADQEHMIRQLAARLAKLEAKGFPTAGSSHGDPEHMGTRETSKQQVEMAQARDEPRKLRDTIALHAKEKAELEERNTRLESMNFKLESLNSELVQQALERGKKNVKLTDEVASLRKQLDQLKKYKTTPDPASTRAPATATAVGPATRPEPRSYRVYDIPSGTSLGLTTATYEGGIFVQHVEEGSPAARSGLHFGDRVLFVNGIDSESVASLDALVAAGPPVSEWHIMCSPHEERQVLERDPDGVLTPREMTSNMSSLGNGKSYLEDKTLLSVNDQSTRNLNESQLEALLNDPQQPRLALSFMRSDIFESLDASGHQIVTVSHRPKRMILEPPEPPKVVTEFMVSTRGRKSKCKK